MNIQELQLVLDAVKTVSGDASEVAIWWIVGSYVLTFILNVVIVFAVVLTITKIVKTLVGMNEWATIGKNLSRAWGGSGCDTVYSEDLSAIEEILSAGKGWKKRNST